MFREMVETLARGGDPDRQALRRRFDMALTKKMGIIRLPPAFWMGDPKMNPRTDHLLWAALLLLDREAIDAVLSVMAVELAETKDCAQSLEDVMHSRVRGLTGELLALVPDSAERRRLDGKLERLIPEWLQQQTGSHG